MLSRSLARPCGFQCYRSQKGAVRAPPIGFLAARSIRAGFGGLTGSCKNARGMGSANGWVRQDPPLPPAPDQKADGFLRLRRFEPRPLGVREHDRAHTLALPTTTPRNSERAHRLLGIGLMLPLAQRGECGGSANCNLVRPMSRRPQKGDPAASADRRGKPMTVAALHSPSIRILPAKAQRCPPHDAPHGPILRGNPIRGPNESAVAAGSAIPSRPPKADSLPAAAAATVQRCSDFEMLVGVTLHGRSSLGIRWLQ